MMKLAVFGATGRTGAPLVRKALERGHEVVALVRSPQKLKEQQGEHECLRYVVGDIQDAKQVEEAISGADAVLSVLGPTQNKPDYEVSRGTQNIVKAMRAHGVRRLVVSAGAGVGGEGDEPKLFNRFINIALKLAARHVFEDMTRTVALVRGSDLDWTVVRVPMLTDDPGKGNVRVGYVGKGSGPRLSRDDMAEFILKQVADETHIRKSPVISN
jgi:putative NADH-flavin reductase